MEPHRQKKADSGSAPVDGMIASSFKAEALKDISHLRS